MTVPEPYHGPRLGSVRIMTAGVVAPRGLRFKALPARLAVLVVMGVRRLVIVARQQLIEPSSGSLTQQRAHQNRGQDSEAHQTQSALPRTVELQARRPAQ